MRRYLDIHLDTKRVHERSLEAVEIAQAGRYHITRTLLDMKKAEVDPLSVDNPLIFSVGPFAGTNFSNANRLSIGCKSPLTGGVKESNSGGTFGFAMGQLEIAGFTLHGGLDDWGILYIPKEGAIRFLDGRPYLGLGNFECAKQLHAGYGDKISIALCGPVGEYLGLMAGIAVSDVDNRPSRLSARGGVGAVMGTKKIKAIIIEKHKMPPMHDRRNYMGAVKLYNKLLDESVPVHNFRTLGTAMVADHTNVIGALPVRNFSSGQAVNPADGPLKVGGDYIRKLNESRGGEITHACMPGCMIKCSNVYVDETGKEVVSPMEYETIGLLGTNCGINDPDDVARLNEIANDLGIDTIELGATLALLMEKGEAQFGDMPFMMAALEDIRRGSERGRLLAQGTARVGDALNMKRVPVIKKQAISAYDPRVVEATGISMMYTAQGADHTTGNSPSFVCDGKSVREVAEESVNMQIGSAVADCFGLCIFGRSVTNTNFGFIAEAINHALGADFDGGFIINTAIDAILLEKEFNRQAGFHESDDELPAFFIEEALPPTNKTARLHSSGINSAVNDLLQEHRYS